MERVGRASPPAITATGNGEERAAQIKNIQYRVERIRRVHEQLSSEMRQLTNDVKTLDGGVARQIPATHGRKNGENSN
jgi:hypothetical protein